MMVLRSGPILALATIGIAVLTACVKQQPGAPMNPEERFRQLDRNGAR